MDNLKTYSNNCLRLPSGTEALKALIFSIVFQINTKPGDMIWRYQQYWLCFWFQLSIKCQIWHLKFSLSEIESSGNGTLHVFTNAYSTVPTLHIIKMLCCLHFHQHYHLSFNQFQIITINQKFIYKIDFYLNGNFFFIKGNFLGLIGNLKVLKNFNLGI